MKTERLEELLERIVAQDDELISEVRDLNSKLESIESSLRSIEGEADWVNPHGTAKRLVDASESIKSVLESLERNS